MTKLCFELQLDRLKRRFGEKPFDIEFTKLVHTEMKDLSDDEYTHVVETLIGSRTPKNPPLIVDFREQRAQIERVRLAKKAVAVTDLLTYKGQAMEDVLERLGFAGCKTLHEAVERQAAKLRGEKSDEVSP